MLLKNRVAVLTLLTLVTAGCGSQNSERELTYWSANNPYEQEFAKEIVAE